MLGILNDVDSPYYKNYTLYEYIGEEFDVLHDGNRIIDISFLPVYMKQIDNSNVEIQLQC